MEGMKEGDVVIVYQNLSHSLELLFFNVIVILMCRKVDLKGPKILQLQVQCYLFYDKIYLLFLITCKGRVKKKIFKKNYGISISLGGSNIPFHT